MAGRLDERYGRVIMAKDKETYDSYAKDVFDNPPAGPVGVHRGARSAGARMTPFLIVLLVVALAGVGTWGVLSGMFSDVLFGNNGTSQAADDKASDSGDSKTGDTTKSGTSEQSTSSSTDGSSDTASIPPRIPPRAIRHRAAATVRPMPPTRTGRGRTPPPRPTRSRRRRPPPRRTRPLPSA